MFPYGESWVAVSAALLIGPCAVCRPFRCACLCNPALLFPCAFLMQERDALLEATPQESADPVDVTGDAEEEPGAPASITGDQSGNGNSPFSLTVIVCVAVAGACVLGAAVIAFLLCGRGGGEAEGEGEGEHMKGVHPYIDDSHLIDGDSKVRLVNRSPLSLWSAPQNSTMLMLRPRMLPVGRPRCPPGGLRCTSFTPAAVKTECMCALSRAWWCRQPRCPMWSAPTTTTRCSG